MSPDTGLLPRVAIWLVPQYPERRLLQERIRSLASRYSGPVFVPHMTLYSCHRTPQQQELAVLARIARSRSPLLFETEDYACGSSLTKAFYLRLMSSPAAEELQGALHRELPRPSTYQFEPHVSLLYQELSQSAQAELLQETRLRHEDIRFDQLWAVAIPERLRSAGNLSGWQTLLTCRLASEAIAATL